GFRKLALQPAHFYLEHDREVFSAAHHLAGRGEPIDVLTITEELRRMGALDRIGGPAYLAGLVEQAAILVNLPAYERLVFEEARRRDYLALAKRLEYGATNGTSAAELAAMVEQVAACHRRSTITTDAGPHIAQQGDAYVLGWTHGDRAV